IRWLSFDFAYQSEQLRRPKHLDSKLARPPQVSLVERYHKIAPSGYSCFQNEIVPWIGRHRTPRKPDDLPVRLCVHQVENIGNILGRERWHVASTSHYVLILIHQGRRDHALPLWMPDC